MSYGPVNSISSASLINSFSGPENIDFLDTTGISATPTLVPSYRPSTQSLRSEQLASIDYGMSLVRQNPLSTGSYWGDLTVHAFTELGATVDRARVGLTTHFRADTQRDRVDTLLHRNDVVNKGRSFNTFGGLTQLYAISTTDQIAFGAVGYDPLQDRALNTTERITSIAGGTGAYAASWIPIAGAATRAEALLTQGPSLPRTLQGLQNRVDTYADRAQLKAFDKGLSGVEAGNYADRYFNKAVNQLDRRLVQAGSDYRVFSQYGRDVYGVPLDSYNRPNGSLFLDAAVTNRAETTAFSGWDTRFQSTPYPRWNTNTQNAAYVNRFQIQEGFVREISVEARRP